MTIDVSLTTDIEMQVELDKDIVVVAEEA